MEELSYTSKFDGETTDDILRYANEGKTEKVNEYVKSMNVQDSKGEPDTVQVYDTNGVPHKVSKTELLKKSTLALPELEDISAFVAVNAAGNAIGLMTKEQVASVLAELMFSTPSYNGDLNELTKFDGVRYYKLKVGCTNAPSDISTSGGVLIPFDYDGYTLYQILLTINGKYYARRRSGDWTGWKEL